jgi:ParB-like chromosome segregation protein Spo0J
MPKASKNNAAVAATEQITAVPEGLKIVLRPLESLVPYARNPRAHSNEQVAQIAASIKEFGFTNPILLDGENGLIAGHGRLAAARLLGLKTVPCIELGHLSETQKRAYIIADNKLALNAGWDEELLRLELIDLKGLEFNLDLLGFNASELADITLGRDVDQPEYDETATDDVKMVTCPKCGQSFPK